MDQRVYYGYLNPNALADYLVSIYHQPLYTRAQKIVQGERIFVQIMRSSDWGGSGRRALGMHISRVAGGIIVEMGSSDWLDIDEAGLAGMLLGALFFPPLLLFPLIQGLAGSSFSREVWHVVDMYCTQASASQGYPSGRGFYCTYCGAFNHPGAPRCHSCHAPFNVAPPPAEQPAATPGTPPPAPEPSPEPQQTAARATGETRPMFALMICPNCKATVVPAHFCGNCAAPLPDVDEEKPGKEEEKTEE